MNIPETMKEVMKQDGVVAIVTMGPEGPHMVNTWNSYLRISEEGRLMIPAGYYHRTERNIASNDSVLITIGSSKVRGLAGPGTGFLIRGKAAFLTDGPEFEATKARFQWARAALAITIESVTQTL